MGQYFIIANMDRKEFIHPHSLNTGAKLWEICANNVGRLLLFLLRKSNEGGGGDICKEYDNAGRWAGDRIAVIGDYDESGIYDEAKGKWQDISKEANKEFEDFMKN